MPLIYDLDNLFLAYYKARKGKSNNYSVKLFSKNLFDNILHLQEQIRTLNVNIGKYHYFKIYDPKERMICAASFEERIIHHAIINICKPVFERFSIYDSYATREHKGVYSAIDRAKVGIKKYNYVAKLDVRKYFDSISHNVLKDKLLRLFKDKHLLALLFKIIDSYSTSPLKGIPIGNLTSQYFANYYLGFLDHYVKEKLLVPMYIRYMDDMLVFADNKDDLKKYVKEIDNYLKNELKLVLKTPQIIKTQTNVSFLGYNLSKNKILLNRRSKIRFKTKFNKLSKLYSNGYLNEKLYLSHLLPLLAFVKYAYTKQLRKSILQNIVGNR